MTPDKAVNPAASEGEEVISSARGGARAVEAPSVSITGLTIARSILQQRDEPDGADGSDQRVTWRIYGYAPGIDATEEEGPSLIVFGDLLIKNGGWVVGATAVALLEFVDPTKWLGENQASSNEAVSTLGPWLSHVLYDTAATMARNLLSSTPARPLEVPGRTPEAAIELD